MWLSLATNDDDVGQDSVWLLSLIDKVSPLQRESFTSLPTHGLYNHLNQWDLQQQSSNVLNVTTTYYWFHLNHNHESSSISLTSSSYSSWPCPCPWTRWLPSCWQPAHSPRNQIRSDLFPSKNPHTFTMTMVCMFLKQLYSPHSLSCSLGYFSSQTSVSAEYPSHQTGVQTHKSKAIAEWVALHWPIFCRVWLFTK